MQYDFCLRGTFFEDHLRALGEAHSLLTRESLGAPTHQIVEWTMAPLGE